jgi:hypothetical protein
VRSLSGEVGIGEWVGRKLLFSQSLSRLVLCRSQKVDLFILAVTEVPNPGYLCRPMLVGLLRPVQA